MKPALIILFNYIFIPTLVDYFSYYEGYELKSRRHKANLLKQFIIIMIASVFIPISGNETFVEYMKEAVLYVKNKDIELH